MSDLYFGQGIPVSAGFDLGSPKPLDARTVAANLEELQAMPEVRRYTGLSVYVVSEKCKYVFNGTEFEKELNSGYNGKDGYSVLVSSAAVSVDDESGIVTVPTANVTPAGAKVGDKVLFTTGKIYQITEVSDATLTLSTQPVANIKGADGKTGDKGDPFTIYKTYASVEAMNNDFSNEAIPEGAFVIISSNVEDEDNAKLYVKGADAYTFITGLSGAQGIKGEAASIQVGTVTTVESTETAEVTNSGNSTEAVFDFKIPKGKDGIDGDQIKLGKEWATATDATCFFHIVSEVTGVSNLSSNGIGEAEIGNTPISNT